jgi:hypothetical protein
MRICKVLYSIPVTLWGIHKTTSAWHVLYSISLTHVWCVVKLVYIWLAVDSTHNRCLTEHHLHDEELEGMTLNQYTTNAQA